MDTGKIICGSDNLEIILGFVLKRKALKSFKYDLCFKKYPDCYVQSGFE